MTVATAVAVRTPSGERRWREQQYESESGGRCSSCETDFHGAASCHGRRQHSNSVYLLGTVGSTSALSVGDGLALERVAGRGFPPRRPYVSDRRRTAATLASL